MTFWACSAGFFRILRTSFAFRPEKLVLSLKQANVVGRLAAMFMRGLTCVAFEHIAEYRAQRFQTALRTAPALALQSASTRCGPIPQRRSRRRAAISSRRRERHAT